MVYLYRLTGLNSVVETGQDACIIILTRCLRMCAYGFNALILALFFQEIGFSDDVLGIFFSLTLVGDVLLSLFLTLVADGLGRRRVLFFGSALMVVSGGVFACSENYWVLLFAAVVGVISPSGSEIGPFRAVEESTLSHLTVPETRAEVLTWYIVTATVGTSGGLVFCGNLVDLLQHRGWSAKEAYHALFWIYSACGAINMVLTLFLSSKCEVDGHSSNQQQQQQKEEYQSLPQSEPSTPISPQTSSSLPPPISPTTPKPNPNPTGILSKFAQISPQSRPILYKLTAIMSLDSLASGMASYSLINLYLDRKFSLPKGTLATIISITTFISAFMNIWSAALSKKIGLIKTMVFTHLPSAIFLALLPASPSLSGTIVLLFARASLNSMDQAPRTAFIAAIVRSGERTAVMGIVNVVKILAQSGGPSVTGFLAGRGVFWVAFLLAGLCKVCYDLGLLTLFVGMRVDGRGGEEKEGGLSRDEEDLAGLLVDSADEDEPGEEEVGGIDKDVRSGERPSAPKKSFSFPRKTQGLGDEGYNIGSDLASPKGHKRTDSFPLKEVR